MEPVIRLTHTPPANAFVTAERVPDEQEVYPLDLFLCGECGHLQLLDVVDPEILFRDYVYVPSTSPVFVEHFREYAEEVIEYTAPPDRSLVVEIGSNDGTFLRWFHRRGLRVLGVDPAKEIARGATGSGIETWPVFFTPEVASRIEAEHGRASIVAANNVFAHVDDLGGMTEAIRGLLTPDGIFVFEVSYLLDVVRDTLFDTIYHEHLSYHAVRPLETFFRRHGMELIDVCPVATHGGSLRGTVQVAGGPRAVSPSVAEMSSVEDDFGLQRADTMTSFAARIEELKLRLSRLVNGLKGREKAIGGFGAPAKATTLLYHLDLGGVIDFIVDDSPLKQGLFTPGHHIPVLPASAMYDRRPDYVLILAWNFAQSIIKKHGAFLDGGGHFIVPAPEVQVV